MQAARLVRLFGLLCGLALSPGWAASDVIYVGDEPRFAEYIELLRLALDKSSAIYGPYRMRPAEVAMNESRALLELRSGTLVNVVWSATSMEKEAQLLPIRIPLGKGILGYRIALIAEAEQGSFGHVQTPRQLARYRFCLGPGWGDVSIYRAAGLRLEIANYESLFRMTELGRCHFFSRGINEVFAEHAARRSSHPGLAIETSLLLHYTYPYYFFVSPAAPELAARIEAGLRTMVADGSYDAVFWKHNREAIEQAALSSRYLIELSNPDLPPATPLGDRRLWYRPGQRP